MKTPLLLLLASLAPACVLAQGCDVTVHSQSAAVPVIATHTCYEYQGMPDDAIDWSCSNESKQMLASTQKRVDQCAQDYQATCSARLTQETLANPRATRKDENSKPINVPDNARIVTRYYDAKELSQARIDCEMDGGRWEIR